MSKTFYASRLSARHSGKPVKDAGKAAKKGQRWYTEASHVETVVAAVTGQAAEPVADPVLQGIFDGAAKHLLKQNAKSLAIGSSYNCRYRGPAGKMCAIGPFIADVHYSEKLEGGTVSRDSVILALKKSGFPVHNPQAMQLAEKLKNCKIAMIVMAPANGLLS